MAAMIEEVPVPDRAERSITDEQWNDAVLIWCYHQMGHEVRPCSAAIGLGSHDLGVATATADLYGAGLFPVVVFSGGNSPTTAARFPRGDAVHYRERALDLGVPDKAILLGSSRDATTSTAPVWPASKTPAPDGGCLWPPTCRKVAAR